MHQSPWPGLVGMCESASFEAAPETHQFPYSAKWTSFVNSLDCDTRDSIKSEVDVIRILRTHLAVEESAALSAEPAQLFPPAHFENSSNSQCPPCIDMRASINLTKQREPDAHSLANAFKQVLATRTLCGHSADTDLGCSEDQSSSQSLTSRASTNPQISTKPRIQASASRERFFALCFPLHRTLFCYPTQKYSWRSLKAKSSSLTPALSLSAGFLALCSDQGFFQVFKVHNNLNESPAIIHNGELSLELSNYALQHHFVAMNSRWVVFALSLDGAVVVVSLASGKVLFTHKLGFGVQAVTVSDSGSLIACSIVASSKNSTKQPMVVLICPNTRLNDTEAFDHPDIVSFQSPYRDPLDHLCISSEETRMLCASSRESRFFIISLLDPREPRVVMRSSRKTDPQSDQEGITSMCFFASGSRILVGSSASACPPVILETKLAQQNQGVQGDRLSEASAPSSSRLQPSVLMRVDKLGHSIHQVVASPRENAAAFLDTKGIVYAMHWPRLSESRKRIAVCCEVAPSETFRKAAALQFSADGTFLAILDTRGTLHLADFASGAPTSPGMSKLRELS